MRPRGFTLIELLVVVIIMALLCAILITSLGKARDKAKRVACGQTLHGLAIGLKTYLSEFREIYPYCAQMPSLNTLREPLPVALKSQIPAPRAWKCVADQIPYTRTDGSAFDSYFDGEALSFEYNMGLGGKKLEQDFLYPLVGPTGVFVLVDFDHFHDAPRNPNRSKNILFADGHVGSIDDLTTRIGPLTQPGAP